MLEPSCRQGLPDGIFSNQKNPNFAKFSRALKWKRPIEMYCGHLIWQFGNLVAVWYIFHRFGKLCQEKSGNPDAATD
jgi:hypothetical protein